MVDVPRAALRVFADAHSRRRGGASTNYYLTHARERPFKQSGHVASDGKAAIYHHAALFRMRYICVEFHSH
jgi:hypothetical protein